MNPDLMNNLRLIIRRQMVKKQLGDYFSDKSISESSGIYPPVMTDLPVVVPRLYNKVEIRPYIESIEPGTEIVKMGWNLFVLGIDRKFLGYTIHESIDKLHEPVTNDTGIDTSVRYGTPKEVIDFIIESLEKHRDDLLADGSATARPNVYSSKIPAASTYYERNKLLGNRL